MLKLCHHVCFTQKNNGNVLSTICDSIDIVTFKYSDFLTRPWRVFVTGNAEKLTVISPQLMTKSLDKGASVTVHCSEISLVRQ